MDTRELRWFVALAEHRSFTRAAAAVGVTQQAMSQVVARLERRTGTALVVRRPRGAGLTPAGEELLAAARDLVAHADAVEARWAGGRPGPAAPAPDAPAVRVGVLVDGFGGATAPLLARLRQQEPGARVVTRQLGPSSCASALLTGQVDAVLAHGPVPADDRLAAVEVFREPRAVVVARTSPLADAHALAVADLLDRPVAARHPLVPPGWEGFFTLRPERGEEPHRVGEHASTFPEVLWNVALLDAVLTVPAHLQRSFPGDVYGVAYVPVPDLVEVTSSVLTRARPGPAAAAVVAAAAVATLS